MDVRDCSYTLTLRSVAGLCVAALHCRGFRDGLTLDHRIQVHLCV